MNNFTISGRFTKDPELRTGKNASGDSYSYLFFSLAVSKTKEKTDFLDFVVSGKRAESIAKYFSKGKPIEVYGILKQQKKESKMICEVKGFEFVLSDPTKSSMDSSSGDFAEVDDDGDLPF